MKTLKTELDEALCRADAAPTPAPQEIVEHVFETMTPDQQRAWEVLRDRA